MKLVVNMDPKPGNARNSEGSFIRMPDGGILFAYSRYSSDTVGDDDSCDIAVIRSFDEGETWSEPEIIVRAADFGVQNVMSVSCIYQLDGRIGIYYLIKELDKTSTWGRALTCDGYDFHIERCIINSCPASYVVNNDRVERFADGTLVVPACRHIVECGTPNAFGMSMVWVSHDDGKTFDVLPHRITVAKTEPSALGMQEPGIFQHKDGRVRLWARTSHRYQYECYSYDDMKTFSMPGPSCFGSAVSPMEIAENKETGVLYAVYNPVADVDPARPDRLWVRTPLLLQTSRDDGRTWSDPVVIEGDPYSGYCYPAMFFTKDGSMLLAYCRGGKGDDGCLSRLGMMKIGLQELE